MRVGSPRFHGEGPGVGLRSAPHPLPPPRKNGEGMALA